MKTVAAYIHHGEGATQEPDNKPGNYYVSARDGQSTWLLLGPFVNDHAAALARVDAVRALAVQSQPLAHFYAFGTCRMASDYTKPGSANKYFL